MMLERKAGVEEADPGVGQHDRVLDLRALDPDVGA